MAPAFLFVSGAGQSVAASRGRTHRGSARGATAVPGLRPRSLAGSGSGFLPYPAAGVVCDVVNHETTISGLFEKIRERQRTYAVLADVQRIAGFDLSAPTIFESDMSTLAEYIRCHIRKRDSFNFLLKASGSGITSSRIRPAGKISGRRPSILSRAGHY